MLICHVPSTAAPHLHRRHSSGTYRTVKTREQLCSNRIRSNQRNLSSVPNLRSACTYGIADLQRCSIAPLPAVSAASPSVTGPLLARDTLCPIYRGLHFSSHRRIAKSIAEHNVGAVEEPHKFRKNHHTNLSTRDVISSSWPALYTADRVHSFLCVIQRYVASLCIGLL